MPVVFVGGGLDPDLAGQAAYRVVLRCVLDPGRDGATRGLLDVETTLAACGFDYSEPRFAKGWRGGC